MILTMNIIAQWKFSEYRGQCLIHECFLDFTNVQYVFTYDTLLKAVDAWNSDNNNVLITVFIDWQLQSITLCCDINCLEQYSLEYNSVDSKERLTRLIPNDRYYYLEDLKFIGIVKP